MVILVEDLYEVFIVESELVSVAFFDFLELLDSDDLITEGVHHLSGKQKFLLVLLQERAKTHILQT